jgi:hypothetical protein
MKTLRLILTSHMLLAVVAAQVFIQVWLRVTDWPTVGLLISVWLSWKLGCLAAHADITTVWAGHARRIKADIDDLNQWFHELPDSERMAHGLEMAHLMLALTEHHQRIVANRDRPYDPPKFLELFPNPVRYYARRRERKALIDLRDSFK